MKERALLSALLAFITSRKLTCVAPTVARCRAVMRTSLNLWEPDRLQDIEDVLLLDILIRPFQLNVCVGRRASRDSG